MLHGMINIINEYLVLGLIVVSILCLLCFVGYFFIYKRLLHGKKTLNIKKVLLVTIFTSYVFLVLGATMLRRSGYTWGSINLELFNAYNKAMFNFSMSAWRDILLNIIMFVPLGFLLPLLNVKLYKPYYTLLISFCFTFAIELIQLTTKIGAFDIDDIFNNFLGAMIGYCIIMIIISAIYEKKHKKRNIILYLLPLLFIVGVFLSFFIIRNLK